MASELTNLQIKILQENLPVDSLEELCGFIEYELDRRGETKGKITVKALPSDIYDRIYLFAGTYFKELCLDESKEEVMKTGVNNLKHFFPEPKYGVDSLNDSVRIYKKSPEE